MGRASRLGAHPCSDDLKEPNPLAQSQRLGAATLGFTPVVLGRVLGDGAGYLAFLGLVLGLLRCVMSANP